MVLLRKIKKKKKKKMNIKYKTRTSCHFGPFCLILCLILSNFLEIGNFLELNWRKKQALKPAICCNMKHKRLTPAFYPSFKLFPVKNNTQNDWSWTKEHLKVLSDSLLFLVREFEGWVEGAWDSSTRNKYLITQMKRWRNDGKIMVFRSRLTLNISNPLEYFGALLIITLTIR